MSQDINKIIDNLSTEWMNDAATLRKRVAILVEENSRLKQEIEELKADKEEGE